MQHSDDQQQSQDIWFATLPITAMTLSLSCAMSFSVWVSV